MKALAAFVVVSLFATGALAKPKKLSNEAKRCLEDAEGTASGGNEDEAVAKYQACYTKFPDPDFLVYIGLALVRLRRYPEALASFEECAAKTKDKGVKADATTNISLIQEILATSIAISSTPPGAQVWLNSKVDALLGVTPFTANVPAGAAILIVELPGYQTLRTPIDVKKNERTELGLTLQLAPVTFRFETTPSGAAVFVDGVEVGKTPYEGPLSLGAHELTATKSGFGTYRSKLEAKKGEPLQLQVALPPPDGTLVLNLPVPNAEIEVDGLLQKGTTLSLSGGMHEVRVRAPGYREERLSVELRSGQTTQLPVTLREEGLYVTLPAGMTGARFMLDGAPLQDLSAPLYVPRGKSVRLSAKKDGALPAELLLSGDLNQDAALSVDFRAPTLRYTYAPLALTVLAAGAGTIFGLQAIERTAAFEAAPTVDGFRAAKSAATRSNIGFGLSLVFGGGTAYLALQEKRGKIGRSVMTVSPEKK